VYNITSRVTNVWFDSGYRGCLGQGGGSGKNFGEVDKGGL